jgi:hypothetical protein
LSSFLLCRSELPPMCFWPMKMFGTVVWLVSSARVDWIAEPSSGRGGVRIGSVHRDLS